MDHGFPFIPKIMLLRTITSDFSVPWIMLFHTSICLNQGTFMIQNNMCALVPGASSANPQQNLCGFRLTLCSFPTIEFKHRQQ